MDEFIWDILKIAIPIIASVIIALVGYGKSKRIANDANETANDANTLATEAFSFAKEVAQESKRPKVKLVGLTLDPTKADVYVGKNLVKLWKANPIDGKDPNTRMKVGPDYSSLFNKDSKYTRRNGLLIHPINYREYMFINLCENVESMDDIILAFNVLNITIDLGSDKIGEFKIEKAFSIQDDKSFGNDIKIDFKRSSPKQLLEIPVAYASKHADAASIHLETINRLRISDCEDDKKIIDYLNLESIDEKRKAGACLGFDETGYLFKCTTEAEKYNEYLYSIYMHKSDGMLTPHERRDGKSLFYEKVDGRDIIQHSID